MTRIARRDDAVFTVRDTLHKHNRLCYTVHEPWRMWPLVPYQLCPGRKLEQGHMADTMSDETNPASQTPPETNDKGRRRSATLNTFQSFIDEQISEAMERGDFDNLRGKGRPLPVEENLFAGDWELAFKMLKDNNFTLPWIDDRNRLLEAINALRQSWRAQWQTIGPELQAMVRIGQHSLAQHRWNAVLTQWRAEIRAVNAQIETLNVNLPVRHLEVYKLTLNDELSRLGAAEEL